MYRSSSVFQIPDLCHTFPFETNVFFSHSTADYYTKFYFYPNHEHSCKALPSLQDVRWLTAVSLRGGCISLTIYFSSISCKLVVILRECCLSAVTHPLTLEHDWPDCMERNNGLCTQQCVTMSASNSLSHVNTPLHTCLHAQEYFVIAIKRLNQGRSL